MKGFFQAKISKKAITNYYLWVKDPGPPIPHPLGSPGGHIGTGIVVTRA
jgi:hypothetical protein